MDRVVSSWCGNWDRISVILERSSGDEDQGRSTRRMVLLLELRGVAKSWGKHVVEELADVHKNGRLERVARASSAEAKI